MTRQSNAAAQQAHVGLLSESSRALLFADKMSLAQLRAMPFSPRVERALEAIGKAESCERENPRTFEPANFHRELQESLGALEGNERTIVKAFIARCLYKLQNSKLSPQIRRTQVWRLLATGSPAGYVAIYSIIRDDRFKVDNDCVRDASLALASNPDPHCQTLAGKVAAAVTEVSTYRIHKYKDEIIKGLAAGTSIGMAVQNFERVITSSETRTLAGTNVPKPIEDNSSSYLPLARKLLLPQCAPALHQALFEEFGKHKEPGYIQEHPLYKSTFRYSPLMTLPPCVLGLLCIGVNSLNPKTQRAAVSAVLNSFRAEEDNEGYFISSILAKQQGGWTAQKAAEDLLEQFPKSRQRSIKNLIKGKDVPVFY